MNTTEEKTTAAEAGVSIEPAPETAKNNPQTKKFTINKYHLQGALAMLLVMAIGLGVLTIMGINLFNLQGEDLYGFMDGTGGIERLHPEAQRKAEELIRLCAEKNFKVRITTTFITKKEQDALYAVGRTAPGRMITNIQYPNDVHNWGVAFHFCKDINGKELDNTDGFFEKVGNIAKSMNGLSWGGDGKSTALLLDRTHLELTEFLPNGSTASLKKEYGTPENFIKTWGK